MSDIRPVPITDILKNVVESCDWFALHDWTDWLDGMSAKVADYQFMDLLEDLMVNGQKDPIVLAMDPDGWVLGNGHHRLTAAILLGWDTILCIDPEPGCYDWHPDSNNHEWHGDVSRRKESEELADLVTACG